MILIFRFWLILVFRSHLTKYDQQFQRELDYFISQEMHILYKYETCITLRDSYIRECILDEYRNISKGSYLYQLFSCHYFLKTDENTVIFVTENKVSSEKKSVIISATPNIEIYTRLYKTDLKVYSVENVISKGRIVQDSERSYTRQSIKNESNSELVSRKVKEINDNSAIEAVITFKGYRHHFPNKDTSIYFFSSEGTDKLKGKDIAVFGTPIIPPSTTLLYATLCGVIITEDDVKKMTYRKVEFDDFTFKFNTYVNPELSRIHLSLIQQELTQAVGRNRYLTEDCTVYLYSSFPIRVFNEKDVKATDDAGIIVLESSVEEENIIDVITSHQQPKPIKRTPMTERLAPDKEMRREMKTDEQKTIPPIQKKQYTAEEDEELRQLLDELFK